MTSSNLTLEAYVSLLIRQSAKRCPSPFVVSAVGGGGKTTTLIHLFDASLRPRSILTSTTALGVPGADDRLAPPLSIKQKENAGLARISMSPPPISGVWLGPAYEDSAGKHRGVGKEELDAWVRKQRSVAKNDTIILCEADGSKRKPLKAHADHEPVIPKTTDLTLIILGLSGLGKALDESCVHRAHIFSQATGLKAGEAIEIPHLIALLRSGLFFKGVPPTSEIAVVFNQLDCLEENQRTGGIMGELAARILDIPEVSAVFFNGLDKGEQKTWYGQSKNSKQAAPFSAVILAAGMSERMGRNKLLLPLDDQLVICQTVSRVLASHIRDLVVVLGFEAGPVKKAVESLTKQNPDAGVTFVTNDRYREGQGTSVACGTRQLAENSLACFYVPGDQPFVSPLLMRHLMEEFETGMILVPVIDGTRSSPVLFDRRYYGELSALTGDTGGRQVIQKHPHAVIEIPGHDLPDGFDIDTPEDYEKALKLE